MGTSREADIPSGSIRTQVGAERKSGPKKSSRSKTALVLGGGGFTGAVYEIGALRALNLLAVNRTVNDFDIYVGTSAGSFVCAFAANGVPPEQMMWTVINPDPSLFPELRADTVLRPNYEEFLKKGVKLPWHLFGMAKAVGRSIRSLSAVDLFVHFADALPSGFYSGSGIERYVREILEVGGRTDDFRDLEKDLFICAADLDTCERVVLGKPGWEDVPISKAVRASSAVPMVYSPTVVKGRTLVDGGLVSTTNIELAVEAGAELIVVINPIVPFVNERSEGIEASTGERVRSISEMGFPKIAYQTFKLLAYQRLHELMDTWETRYPGVDIVLIEPSPDDELMFETNILNYTSRIEVARHGFHTVTHKLGAEYPRLKEVAEKHGIELSPARLRKVLRHFEADTATPAIWRRIFERSTSVLLRQSSAK